MLLSKFFGSRSTTLVRVLGCRLPNKGIVPRFCSNAAGQPDETQNTDTRSDGCFSGEDFAEAFAKFEETDDEDDQDSSQQAADASDEDYMKPMPRRERAKKALAKLKKGPDGRFINVLEVTSDLHMLIAAYQNLKAKSRPTYLIENSDDEDSMEGIDLRRFRKLQKRLRSGTYRFGTTKKKEPDEQ